MRVAVLFGGISAERDVSVASAAQIMSALIGLGHRVEAFDLAKGRLSPADVERVMRAKVAPVPPDPVRLPTAALAPRLVEELLGVDVVFLALHGGAGEDGVVQAVLDSAGLPYTGSGHLASAVAMDKDIAKRLLRASGIPTPQWVLLRPGADPGDIAFDGPVIVKPNAQGSSIGLTLVKGRKDLDDAVRTARLRDADVLVERFVPGREFVVGVLDASPLAVGEIRTQSREIFDYAAKYQAGGALEIFPADIPAAVDKELRDLAVRAHDSLRLGAYSRVDFRMDHKGGIWCLEANTLPGMTATSLFPQSAQAAGISFPELCERICRLAARS
ncbi:D-alanine--D-alanine ligase [Nonomuraea sp. SMC257]|uniref:D-alanine--D-alanine ligase n=1 Tax=Nonomuraea montanisoli TaxID=2741721 RepID=A0A7Y6I7Z3_9ACTN|nr:D-alanine--D-alanine ligase [Nonomuraea montanisoli]NUW33402.1 D-alanine--D-alanine ligase [Nonomuraea montanisoli]